MAITKGVHNLKYNMNTLISATTNRPVKPGEGKIKPHLYYCEVCKVKLTHPMSAVEHFSSKTHFSQVDRENPQGKRKQDESVPEPSAKVSKWSSGSSKKSSVSSKDKSSNRGGSDKNVSATGSSDVSVGGRDKLRNSVGHNRDGFNDKGNVDKEVFTPIDVSRGPGILNPFVAALSSQGIVPDISSNNTVGFDNNSGFGNIVSGFSNSGSFISDSGGLNNPQGFVNQGVGQRNNLQGFGSGVGINNPASFGNNVGGIMNNVSFGIAGNVVNNPATQVSNTNFNNRGRFNNQGGGVSGGRETGVSLGASVNPGAPVNNTIFNNRGSLNNQGGGVSGGRGTGVRHGASVSGGFNNAQRSRGYNSKNKDFDDGKVISHGGFTLSREVKGVQNQNSTNVGPYQSNQQWNISSTLHLNSFGSGQGNVYQGNNPAPYNYDPIFPTANVFGNVEDQIGGQMEGNFRK